ncbi:hypothetical protein KCP74_04395 [Salmonella enterica subsp. enterica]|nr:hypothetical protein KCP74_04395 [Salmonella enterica subsp. enterica]
MRWRLPVMPEVWSDDHAGETPPRRTCSRGGGAAAMRALTLPVSLWIPAR